MSKIPEQKRLIKETLTAFETLSMPFPPHRLQLFRKVHFLPATGTALEVIAVDRRHGHRPTIGHSFGRRTGTGRRCGGQREPGFERLFHVEDSRKDGPGHESVHARSRDLPETSGAEDVVIVLVVICAFHPLVAFA